ncbi:MAG: polysaccharide pyruvyl transferase family protein [Clostridia bacterium]|nr:polysaccharide pyruvyl transferase family protein [Clostridia bacterium]
MKKVGILTFLHNDNYGSSLQAYALQRVIREMGYDAEHIDYRPDRAEKIRNLIISGNSPKLILEGIRKRSVQAGQAGARAKNRAIPAFYEREMKLSPVCRNHQELKKISGSYDLLVCGSDQIWNPVWLNPAYFLDFAEKGQKKLAYAPSLGVRELKDRRKRKKIKSLTEGFEALSAREAEGAALLREITGREADVLPDPVCLLSREAWSEAADKTKEPSLCPQKSLVCYFIGENPDYWARVRELEKETGLPVRVIPVTAESYESGYPLLDGIGPEGFLRAIRDAACLCTDSFHGLVFGTIFCVRTVPLKRYREEDPESKNCRVEHFLRETQQYSLEEIRMKGMDWLKNNLL